MYGFPFGKQDVDTILKNRFIPDAFVFLRIETEIAAKREFKALKDHLGEGKTEEAIYDELIAKY